MQRMLRKFFEEEFLLQNFFFRGEMHQKMHTSIHFIIENFVLHAKKNPDLKRCKNSPKKKELRNL